MHYIFYMWHKQLMLYSVSMHKINDETAAIVLKDFLLIPRNGLNVEII